MNSDNAAILVCLASLKSDILVFWYGAIQKFWVLCPASFHPDIFDVLRVIEIRNSRCLDTFEFGISGQRGIIEFRLCGRLDILEFR